LSMRPFILSPNLRMRAATMKNLAPRDRAETAANLAKSILNVPAAIVKTLYGIGVNPAAPTNQTS